MATHSKTHPIGKRIRVLNAQCVRELLPFERCISIMRHAMSLVARGHAHQPIREVMPQPDGHGMLGWMPAYIEEPRGLGIKVVTFFPSNTEFGPRQGMVLLFDPQNGAPRAIVDAREITAIRMAAVTAVATDVLARKAVRTLGLFGYGEQAHAHAMALSQVRRFEEIRIWGRRLERAQALSAQLQAELNCAVRAVGQPEEAAQADVVCTLTSAAEPFYRAAWLRAGQHLNLVGSGSSSPEEVDTEVIPKVRYFTDYKDRALTVAGEFLRARAAGLVGDEHIIGSIGDVLEGKILGRVEDSQITLFKSLGMVAEDLISASAVLEQAEERGLGDLVDW